jgi:hypothetical protein
MFNQIRDLVVPVKNKSLPAPPKFLRLAFMKECQKTWQLTFQLNWADAVGLNSNALILIKASR